MKLHSLRFAPSHTNLHLNTRTLRKLNYRGFKHIINESLGNLEHLDWVKIGEVRLTINLHRVTPNLLSIKSDYRGLKYTIKES